jgi:hypothetical protein
MMKNLTAEKIMEQVKSGKFDNSKELIVKKTKEMTDEKFFDGVPLDKMKNFLFLSELYEAVTNEIQSVISENSKKSIEVNK